MHHHGRGIFDTRIFGSQGVFGNQIPTEHHDPSAPRPITAVPQPGQVYPVNGRIPVQATQQMLQPITRTAQVAIQHMAPNFQAGAIYAPGGRLPVTATQNQLLPVTATAPATLPIGPQRQTYAGYGSPDGLGHVRYGGVFHGFGSLIGFGG